MNPTRERLLWFFGTALVAAACLGFVLVPASGRYAEARAQLNDARVSRSIAERQGEAFATFEASRAEIAKQSELLDGYFITKDSAVGFLASLDALAAGHGLNAPDVTLPSDVGTGPRLVPLTVTVRGPLSGILAFSEQLTARKPIVSIESLEIVGKPTLTLTLHVQTAWQ
jgi:hypothetical protein